MTKQQTKKQTIEWTDSFKNVYAWREILENIDMKMNLEKARIMTISKKNKKI